jgi:hypothetical protein
VIVQRRLSCRKVSQRDHSAELTAHVKFALVGILRGVKAQSIATEDTHFVASFIDVTLDVETARADEDHDCDIGRQVGRQRGRETV